MNTITKEINQSIQEANETLAYETRIQKQQLKRQERTTALHRAKGKDVVAPATVNEKATASKAKTQPKLPIPTKGGKGNPFDESGGPSIQAIIGEVLILQAKDQSDFWSIVWKQASQAQEEFIKFAPLIARQTKATWDAQAAMSMNESSSAFYNGISDALAAGLAIGMGAFMPEEEAAAGDGEAVGANNIAKDAEEAVANDVEQGGNALKEESQGAFSKVKKFGQAAWKSLGKKNLSKKLMKAMSYAQGMQVMSGASKGFIDSKYKALIAECQKQAGQSDSVAKESEQFAQYWSQLFSRQEDLRGAAQQNLDYGMNVFKSISDTTTQTILSMFRG